MFYSAEKYKDGTSIIFGHYSFGVVPLISIPNYEALEEFIQLLESARACPEQGRRDTKTQIPDVFKKGFENGSNS